MTLALRSFCFAAGLVLAATAANGQSAKPAAQPAKAGVNPSDLRASRTQEFLGLGPPPDKVAAERGAPLYQKNCSFCHGPQARGAEGPNLITSDVVLGDDHGEHLVPFLKKGRPNLGMPSFASVSDKDLTDIAEFLHQQVYDVANRGTYHVLNIVVGNAAKGQAYVSAHCMSCHTADNFAHIASKFRTPDQLQRGWIWPSRPADHSLDITATVKMADGASVSGRVSQIDDFHVALIGEGGETHIINRSPGVEVTLNDPLAAHEAMIMTLKNDDMHDVTAYLETLK
jgi:cytochrome c oxidase cbb3-type subunit III